MRTSRVSQETTKIFSSSVISPTRVRRSTRQAAKTISAFALDSSASIIKSEDAEEGKGGGKGGGGGGGGDVSTDYALETSFSTDIEDSVSTSTRSLGKRKRGSDSPATTLASSMTASSKTRTTPRKRTQPDAVDDHDPPTPRSSSSTRAEKGALPKIPARKITHPDGSVTTQPPANWETVYDTIKNMRLSNPTAPVDTMGCEDLHWRAATPREQRYHTLTALMLSSQTKDTVTAAAMQRLHTELVPMALEPPPSSSSSTTKPTPSTLTIPNILSAPAPHLDSLISKVGFHNTKTRHLQQTARILHDDFASDIPSTLDGLLRLPGVGPKMAYLALSAAWGVDAGIGVDVHVHRITNLWGWHSTRTPEETRAWLEAWLPRQRWHEINRLLVGLGQTVCLPVGRRCGECSLSGTGLCKGEIRGWKAKAKANERRVRGGQGQGQGQGQGVRGGMGG